MKLREYLSAFVSKNEEDKLVEEIGSYYPFALVYEISKLSEEELNGIAFCIMKTTLPKMCYNNTKNGRFDFTVQDNKSYYDVIKNYQGCLRGTYDNKTYFIKVQTESNCKHIWGVYI